MKLFRIKKHALISLILIGTLLALLAPMGNVHATTVRLIKEHYPASTFTDPSHTIDGYFIGQTVTWHIHLNITTSLAPFPWLSISNLTITDTLPNLAGGTPTGLFMTYMAGSQNSSSAQGAAAFTDFGNGTLLWDFGDGPFTTGVLAPPPFSIPNEYWMASITFNATINGNVPNSTYLLNAGVSRYTETVSQVHSAPSISDTIYAASPPTQSSTSVNCSPNPVSVLSGVTCNATVVGGSNPTGNVTWSASSTTGYFSQRVCTLSSGNCSTIYTDNNTGYVTITASYSGDLNNLPSSGTDILTVFVNVTTGSNVTVTPTNNLELTFSNVTSAGYTIANETPTVNAPTLNGTVGQYYDVKVTAGFAGIVTVSLAFDGSNMTQQQKSNLQMAQYTPIPGDIQPAFGQVDMRDIGYIARRFGTNSSSPLWDPAADITGPTPGVPDGKIDMRDIGLVARNFGKTSQWTNITTYVDTTNNIINGETTHFSFIAIH